jgi:hypothetical protein
MSVATAKLKTLKEMENKMAKPKSKLTFDQTQRYKELMRIAEHGDYMSMSEYNELSMLLRIRGYH